MDFVQVGCPKCHERFQINTAGLEKVPAGRVATVRCQKCGYAGGVGRFEKELEKQRRAEEEEARDRQREQVKKERLWERGERRAVKDKKRAEKRAEKRAAKERAEDERKAAIDDAAKRFVREEAERRRARGWGEGAPYGEIGALSMVGTIMLVLGFLALCGAMYVGPELLVGGLGLLYLGVLTRALAGIWGTLERIARK